MPYTFTADEQAQLAAARALCPAGDGSATSSGNWVPFYAALSNIIGARIDGGTVTGTDLQDLKNAKLWLDVAIGANGGTGMHSAFIRTYTNRQGELRLDTEFTLEQMQLASNGVALNLWRGLLGGQTGVAAWTVPPIDRIAAMDASSIGVNLFTLRLPQEDTAIRDNAGWSGALGFNLLGGAPPYQSWRLLTGGEGQGVETSSLNTLDDIKNVLFAVDSYRRALLAGYVQGGLDFVSYLVTAVYSNGIPMQSPSGQALLAQMAIQFSSGNVLGLVRDVAARSPGISPAVNLVADVEPHRMLDMLMGAVQGRALIGTTTADTFASTAHAFFGNLTPAELAVLRVEILPTSATALASRAAESVDARAALAALSPVSVQVSPEVASRFELYNEASGTGTITQRWIADRSEMLTYVVRPGHSNSVVYGGSGLRYADLESGTEVLVGDSFQGQRAQVVFGAEGDDSVAGSGFADRLYGGGGDDALEGQGGADYIEGGVGADIIDGGAGNDTMLGGAGFDTYRTNGGNGRDLVIDADGAGQILRDNAALPQGLRVFDGLWQSADRQVTYTLVRNPTGAEGGERHDLVISFAGSTDRIIVRGWNESSRNLGITFGGDFPQPTVGTAYLGDFIKETEVIDGVERYVLVNGNYVNAGSQPNAADQITGGSFNDGLYGVGGDDALLGQGGEDLLLGGAGNDVLQGGLGSDRILGEDGNDVIYGSSQGSLEMPRLVDFQPPPADQPVVWGQGFNWVRQGSWDAEGVPAALLNLTVQRDDGLGDAGNFIDAGAGHDFVAAGQADDVVRLGDGIDEAFGMAGADVISGGNDRDRIYGDGPAVTQDAGGTLVVDAAGDRHGADVLSGDAGDDVLIGQGNDDIIFGGADNDAVWGDDRDVADTPVSFHGADLVYGGTGNDAIVGGGKGDELYGEIGNDSIWGDTGSASPGSAAYFDGAQHGNDLLDGGAGADVLVGEGGADTLRGGIDADTLYGDDDESRLAPTHHGNDLLDGGAGNDTLYGDGGADALLGGSGDDRLDGGSGADTLAGGTGNDILAGGADADTYTFAAGDGIDRINDRGTDSRIVFAAGVSLANLTATTVQQSDGLGGTIPSLQLRYGADDVITFDGGLGRGFAQVVLGDGTTLTRAQVMGLVSQDLVISGDLDFFANADALVGGAGHDTISGGSGNDTLHGGAGINVITGGSGSDTYEFALAGGADRIDNRAVDTAITTDAVRFADGITADMVGFHRVGNNLVVDAGSTASMTLLDYFAAGRELDRVDQFQFADGTVWSAARVEAHLTEQAPTAGPDVRFGSSGADTLVGGAGNDTLIGEEGNDVLDGGSGSDVYVVSSTSGVDRIVEDPVDGVGHDVIQFEAGVAPSNVLVSSDGDQNFPFFRYGSDLALNVTSGGYVQSQVVVQDFLMSSNSIDEVRFADGTTWTVADIWQRMLGTVPSNQSQGLHGTLGADSIDGLAGNDTIRGYAGDDALQGGEGDDLVYGHAGNDTLAGGTGRDVMYGGAGNNTYLFDAGDGADWIHGRLTGDLGGTDVLRLGVGISAANVVVSRPSYVQSDGLRVESIGDVTLTFGSPGDSVTLGGWYDGPGHVVQRIEFADGTVWTPSDVLARLPMVIGAPGAITGSIRPWVDQLVSYGPHVGFAESTPVVYGTAFAEAVTGGGDNAVLHGLGGDDTLVGAGGNQTLEGGAGSDVYLVGANHGDDVIRDTQGVNVLRFDASIVPGDIDFEAGGSGTFVHYEGGSVLVDGWTQPGATPALDRIEFADGSSIRIADVILGTGGGTRRADILDGSHGNDTLAGLGGNDTLYGYAGDDLLIGGTGSDELRGDEGTDTYAFDIGSGVDHISDLPADATDASVLRYGAGIAPSDVQISVEGDPLYGQWRLTTASGDVVVIDYEGDQGLMPVNRVEFADGAVWNEAEVAARVRAAYAATGAQWLRGTDGAEQLVGGAGNDALYGLAGADTLTGAGGDDLLVGGAGVDVLNGGSGFDDLRGGAGADRYEFSGAFGRDELTEIYGNGEVNEVHFSDRLPSQVYVSHDEWSTYLIDATTHDQVVLRDTWNGSEHDLGPWRITFADGTVWTQADVQAATDLRRVSPGADVWYGTSAAEVVDAGQGDDVVLGHGGNDVLHGADGNDNLTSDSAGTSLLDGGAGVDNLLVDGGSAIVIGGQGDDDASLYGDAPVLILANAGDGHDDIYVGAAVPTTISVGGGLGPEQLTIRRGPGPELVLDFGGQLAMNVYGDDSQPLTLQIVQAGTIRTYDLRTVLADFQAALDADPELPTWSAQASLQSHALTTSSTTAVGGALAYRYAVDGSLTNLPDSAVQSLLAQPGFASVAQGIANPPIVGTAAADLLTGTALADDISGLGGNDTLDGGVGNDTLRGGAGDDIYILDSTGDVVIENAGEGTDTVRSSVSATLAANVERLELTGSNAINATGNDADNTLTGNSATNTLTGGLGSDTYVVAAGSASDTIVDTGGASDRIELASVFTATGTTLTRSGNDVLLTFAGRPETLRLANWFAAAANQIESIVFADGTTWNAAYVSANARSVINGTAAAETLTGTAADDQINGLAGNDTLVGNAGNDTLDGGSGNDSMRGGAGNDTYVVDSASDTVTENAGEGTDTVQSSVTLTTLAANVENLTLTGTAAGGTGNTLANVITGNAANNTINGAGGNDTLIGGAGNDTYTVDSVGDVIQESAGEGTDAVTVSIATAGSTYTLAAEVENMTLGGTVAIHGTGNSQANVITGNSAANTLRGLGGNDTLDGGTGNDTMFGGAGDDTYVMNVATDVVTELAGEGTDTVRTAVTIDMSLAAFTNVENATLTSTTTANLTGNALDNVLTGNGAANRLTGNAGNDTLDGGAGTDTMVGGAGNDTYVVNVATDVVTENANEGIDTVMSSVTLTLTSTNLENLTLTGSSVINATGNANANVLIGNGAANTLSGLGGNDTYDGGGGNDTLTDNSTTSNDIYRWGTGQGNDVINDAGGSADRIELAAGITQSQVTLTRSGNHLVVAIGGTSNTLTVNNWYANAANRVEEIRLADGSVINPLATAPLAAASMATTSTTQNTAATAATGIRVTSAVNAQRASRIMDGELIFMTERNVSALVEAMARFDAQADGAADIVHRAPPREPVWVVPAV